MRLPLRTLCDADLLRAHAAARVSLNGFRQATLRHGSLIQSWVGRADVVALEHYPPGGVVDRQRGSQFFYHCHRAAGAEHGHVHLFWHATRSGRRRRLAPTTNTSTATEAEWSRSAPTHLISIGLDARGLPVSLFSVNQWVTGGHWFDAPTTLCMLKRFELRDVKGTTTVTVLYKGSVPDLFKTGRDVVVDGRLRNGVFVAVPDTLVTKCPSKYAPKR